MISLGRCNLGGVATGRWLSLQPARVPGISKGQGSQNLRPRPAHLQAWEGQKPDPGSLRASFKLGPAGSQSESLACPAHGFESAELGVPSEVSLGHELIEPPRARTNGRLASGH